MLCRLAPNSVALCGYHGYWSCDSWRLPPVQSILGYVLYCGCHCDNFCNKMFTVNSCVIAVILQ